MFTLQEFLDWTGGVSNSGDRDLEISSVAIDSRAAGPGMLFAAFKGANTDGRKFIPQALKAGAVAALVSAPSNMDGIVEICVGDVLKALTDAARGYRRKLRAKIIGVTGSAGKTTTKELLAACLSTIGKTHATSGNNNNALGVPLTILNTPLDADFCVVEMGTNHPGEIEHLVSIAKPDIGVVTNIGNAHIEFFKTLDGTAREKGSLVAALPPDGFAVLDRNGAKFRELSRMASVPVIDVGVDDREAAALEKVLNPTLPGGHNVLNARMAQAVAMRLGASESDILAALDGFAPSGHRWHPVSWHGATVIDDTYNANPESMAAALDTFAATAKDRSRSTVVLGMMGELGDKSLEAHRAVAAKALSLGFRQVIFVAWPHETPLHAPNAGAAREILASSISAGDEVLLKASRSVALEKILE